MYGSATLAMLVSRTSMKAASATTTAISHGLYRGRQTSWSSVTAAVVIQRNLVEIYVRHHVHAGSKASIPVLARLEKNLYRDALDNFHVVSGCILRREQAEQRTGGAGNAVNMTVQSAPTRINVNIGFLSNLHVLELRFLKISGDPDLIKRNNRQELLPRFNI